MGNFTEYAKKRNNQKASSGAFSDYVKRRNTGARTASSSLADNMKTNATIQNAQMRAYNRGVVNNRIASGMMTEKTANTGENAYWDRMSKEDIIDTLRKHDTTPSVVRSGITGASAAVNNTDYNVLYDKLYGDVNKLDDAETRKTVEQVLSDKYRSEYAGMSTKDLEELLGTENREYETKQDRNYASALLEEMQFSEKYGSMSLEELEAEIQKSKLAGIQKNLQNNAVYSGTGKTNEQAKLEALYEQKKYDESHTNVYNSLTQKEKEMVVEVRNLRDKLRSYFGTAGDPVTMSQRKQRQKEKSELEKQISNIEEYFNEKGISVSDMEEYINRMANAEWMKGYNAELAEFSKEHPVLASMYSTAMNFTSPVDAIMLLYNKIQGLPADPNTMIAANTRDTVRGAVSKDMSGFGQFLYSTGMSMADMATLLPLGKVGTLGMFFTSASTSTAKNVLERGGSTDNALKSGLAAGVAEVLFEKFSLDNLFKASSPSTIKQFVKGVLQQSGIEASEEVFTELSNEITDRWINGGLSEYEQNITTYRLMGMSEEQARLQASKDFGMKILEAGAGGALSGGVFGSVAQTGAFYNNTNRHFQEDVLNALEEKTREDVINEIYEAMKDNEHETENDARNDVETAPNKQLVTTDEAMFDPQVKYFTEDGKLELQDGSSVNVEDVLFSDNTRTTLYQHASTEPSYILKNAFAANYRKDNSVSNETEEKLDVLKYRTYYNQVKALTQNGRTLESITKEIGTKLDENTIKNIYTSVQNHMEYLVEKNVGKEQRVLVNKIAKSMGYEVRYTELPEANGMTRDGIIYISTSSENPALVVLAHEVTHNFKIQNPDKYQAYENYVINYMKKYHPEEYKKTVRKLKALYKTNDMNAIHEEIACNMTEEFLMNPDVIEKICKEDKTLAEKIVDFIKDLISKIEQLYKGYNPKSVEARVLKENLDTFNEALGLWMGAMGERNISATTISYSKKEKQNTGDTESIYGQLQNSSEELNKMEIVAELTTPEGILDWSKEKIVRWVIEQLKPTGYRIERKGYGEIVFEEKQIRQSMNYLKHGNVEIYIHTMLPKVLKQGIVIKSKENHKGRNYGTITIAAPVEVNGIRGNMAVTVKETNKNYYKVHRILTPDGKLFKLDENIKEAVLPFDGGVTVNSSLATSTNTASMSSISEDLSNDNRKIKKSLKDINPSIDLSREYEGVGFGEVSGILQNVTEKLKRTKIDPARIKRIADKLVKDCYSKYDSERLAKNLETMFTYLQNTRDLSWREFQMLTSEVMKPVIEQAEYVDKDVKELYDSFISFLRKNPISLASEQREDIQIQYGGMTQYKQLTSGKVVISKDGTSLADYDMWKKICEASGGYLTLDTKVIDRPAELEDAIRHMKPLPIETIGTTGMNMEQRAYDMTLTTLNYYMSAQKDIELRQAADKIEKIQKKKADAIKKSYEKRLKELGEQEAEYRKIIKSNERIKSDERVRRQKAHYEQIQENARERRRKTALRNKIRRLKEKLDKKLIKPTDGSHIPPTLVRSAVEFLDAINLDTGRGTALSEKTKQLKDQYEKFKKDPAFEMDSDERTYAQITHLYEIFDGRNITDLTEQELQWVYEVVDQLYHQIVSESRLIAAEYDKGVYEAAKEVNEVIKESKGATSAPGKFVDWYKIQHLNPINFFRYITGYKECVINDVISHINEAQHRQMKMEMEIEQIFKPVTQGKENQDELRRFVGEDEKDWVEVGGIKMPRSMRLSLVMHSLNDANIKHIVMGGITVPDWELLKKGDVKNAYREGNTVRLFAEELEKARKSESENAYDVLMWQAKKWLRDVSKDLTDYDRKFLECVKKYFHEYSGEKINETTLKLKGYKVAKTHNYFPIHTDTDFLQNEIDVIKFDASLNGSGFLKERRNASNPILLEDMIRLVENHKASTSRYCAFAIPVRDLQKVYNVSFNGWEGSVKKTIAQNWGGKANNYIENLIADIQGARKPKMEELDAVIAKFKNNYASAILTTNASVAISQISGYPLGAAVVGWKPIIKAMAKGGENGTPFGRAERELIDKYTPLLWYRDQGNSTQELGDLAKRNDITQKHQWLTNWLQKMDSATVGRQWYAAEYYVQDEFKNLQEGSDEYYIKVAEVFNEIVEKTQPNYTVMQSAALLRNPSSLWKALFMFKTQAMTNANMLLDTYGEWQATKTEKSRKAFFRALSAQIVSGLIYGATKAAYGLAFYRVSRYWDDEEDKVTLEEILAEIFKDLNSTFAGCFLLGEELYALIESLYTKETYYGPEVTFIAQISDSFSSVVNLRNVFEKYFDGDATIEDVWDKVKEVGFNTSTLAGIPVENAYKLVDGITNHAKDILNNEFFTFNQSGKRSRYTIMYEAMLRGDKERFEEVREELISNSSESNVDSRIKKYLADNDIRIGMAAQAKAEGDFETFEETLAEMTDEGWNKEIVIGAINKAQDALKVEEPEEQKTEIAKVESIYTYSDVTTALENGYTYNAQKAITNLYNTALENGKEADKARSTIKTQITKHFKEKYREGTQEERAQIYKYLSEIMIGKEKLYKNSDFKEWLKSDE